MRAQSIKSKLMLAVTALVVGSGLIITLLETNRFSKSLHDSATVQGEHLSHALALEATNRILTNDLVSLQKLITHQKASNPALAYIFVIKEDQVLAHTFSDGFPAELLQANAIIDNEHRNIKRILSNEGERFLDFAWPIFSGRAGTLRIGLSEKPIRSQVMKLWVQMTSFTLGILLLATALSFFFIRRITGPLAALAQAAETVGEKNLDFSAAPAGRDEVGRLTTAINLMVARIRDYTRRLEKNANELDRAQRQTKNSFEIIKKVWEQDSLSDVCTYLVLKLQEIVACNELVLYFFSSNREALFAFADGEIQTFPKENFAKTLPLLSRMDGVTFVKKIAMDAGLVQNGFESAKHVAAFPISLENQILGALLVPCPDNCKCDLQELEIINLVLNHSAKAIRRAVSREEDMLNIRSRLDVTSEYCGIVGKDPKMQAIYKLIEDIAPTDTTILIQGESGTGKELVASAIHQKSLRKNGPFVVINCSAYPSTLLESELFGHEKGAFTGAVRQKTGRFEQANGGTVFLDEIGEIPASAQIKLLRILQTQKFERVGGEKTLSVDVRIIAATNKDLPTEVRQGTFREDLYYRLNVIPLHLSPLRDRTNDIPLQARYFLQRFAAEQRKDIVGFGPEAMRRLLNYHWPGNVRELENCIEHAVVLAKGARIEVSDLPAALHQEAAADMNGKRGTIMENEAKLLQDALDNYNWNKKQAAESLGISRNTLYRKLRKYRITPPTVH